MEKVIVSLTSWTPRLGNLPTVLDSIFSQTVPPDLVVLNLAENEFLPFEIQDYLINHQVEVNYVPNTKVYKKLVPTLQRYPDDCIISIDDDWIYPSYMIEDFVTIHSQYPNNPISGNKELVAGMACHCGCASLTKASFFDDISQIDEDVIINCPSDDVTYTYFAVKSGHPYIWTNETYFTNLQPYNSCYSYTVSNLDIDYIEVSLDYLQKRFGKLPSFLDTYVLDSKVKEILSMVVSREKSQSYVCGQSSRSDTLPYKLAKAILSPLVWFQTIIRKCFLKS